jgi:hypothetical protein
MALQLEPGKPRALRYGDAMRRDLKLLEVDEELLQELQRDGWVWCHVAAIAFTRTPQRFQIRSKKTYHQ